MYISNSGSSLIPPLVPKSWITPSSFLRLSAKLASTESTAPLSNRIIAVARSSTSQTSFSPADTERYPAFVLIPGLLPSLRKVAPYTETALGLPMR